MTRLLVAAALVLAACSKPAERDGAASATPATANVASAASTLAPNPDRVFEIRTYTTLPGRLEALNARFRNHTMRIFEKHGMTNVGYWIPQDSARKDNTLVYIIAHESRAQADKNWEAFGNDPEWQKVQADSEKDGKIIDRIDSVYARATDYSPIN